jgi:endonuclease G
MDLTRILRDKDLKEELLRRLEPGSGAGRSRAIVVPFHTRVDPSDLRRFVEEAPARLPPPGLDIREAILRRFGRPVLGTRGSTFDEPECEVWQERLGRAQRWLEGAIRAVGRIELRHHPRGIDWVGTGWVIGDGIAVTNRHVAREFIRRNGDALVPRTGLGDRPIEARLNFASVPAPGEQSPFRLESLDLTDDDGPDIALFRIDGGAAAGRLPPPIPLDDRVSQADPWVAVIGYPAEDGRRNEPLLMRQIFGDVFGVKRLALGQVMDTAEGYLTHDCSTLGGNSGSVVLDLGTGRAVGLHVGGEFGVANYAVPAALVATRLAALKPGMAATGAAR